MLTLAFDTATGVATSALVREGEVLGERSSRAVRVLADAEELLEQAGAKPRELSRLVVGAGRREVFTLVEGAPAVVAPDELRVAPGTTCVGDGAVRYREALEALGAKIPPRDSELHLPRARFHAELAHEF